MFGLSPIIDMVISTENVLADLILTIIPPGTIVSQRTDKRLTQGRRLISSRFRRSGQTAGRILLSTTLPCLPACAVLGNFTSVLKQGLYKSHFMGADKGSGI